MNYPRPCDTCKKNRCVGYERCKPWLTRYFYRQKLINLYAKKHLKPGKEEKDGEKNEQR